MCMQASDRWTFIVNFVILGVSKLNFVLYTSSWVTINSFEQAPPWWRKIYTTCFIVSRSSNSKYFMAKISSDVMLKLLSMHCWMPHKQIETMNKFLALFFTEILAKRQKFRYCEFSKGSHSTYNILKSNKVSPKIPFASCYSDFSSI